MTVLGACHIALLDGELPCKDDVPDTIQDTLGSSPSNAADLSLNGGNIEIILIILTSVTLSNVREYVNRDSDLRQQSRKQLSQ
jgi:hypothetical protein